MARVNHHINGNGATKAMEMIWYRWGAGADPGKTHVFTSLPVAESLALGVPISIQCVTDDFGTLVRVEG